MAERLCSDPERAETAPGTRTSRTYCKTAAVDYVPSHLALVQERLGQSISSKSSPTKRPHNNETTKRQHRATAARATGHERQQQDTDGESRSPQPK